MNDDLGKVLDELARHTANSLTHAIEAAGLPRCHVVVLAAPVAEGGLTLETACWIDEDTPEAECDSANAGVALALLMTAAQQVGPTAGVNVRPFFSPDPKGQG